MPPARNGWGGGTTRLGGTVTRVAGRDEIVAFGGDGLLQADAYPDALPVGLQVTGADEVRRIATGVSASLELFRRAADAGAQMLIVHHGLFWDSEPRRVRARERARLQSLFDADLSLVAYHLALDAQPGRGQQRAPVPAARPGRTSRSSEPPAPVPSGSSPPRRATDHARRAGRAGAPRGVAGVRWCSPTGRRRSPGWRSSQAAPRPVSSRPQPTPAPTASSPASRGSRRWPRRARPGIHFIAAGHYATEVFGVRVLGDLIAGRFGVEHVFIDRRNPILSAANRIPRDGLRTASAVIQLQCGHG